MRTPAQVIFCHAESRCIDLSLNRTFYQRIERNYELVFDLDHEDFGIIDGLVRLDWERGGMTCCGFIVSPF